MLFSDRLEFSSPGPLTFALTIKNLSEIHESYPVNPLIADPLFLTQYAAKAGSGTTDMIDACHRAGLPAPEFRADPHRFVTILYRAAKKAGETGPVNDGGKRPGQIPETSSKPGPGKQGLKFLHCCGMILPGRLMKSAIKSALPSGLRNGCGFRLKTKSPADSNGPAGRIT